MKKILFLAAVLVGGVSAGCGGDDGGGGGGGGGISSSRTLGSLTQEEGTTLCNSLADDYPEKTVDCGADGPTTVGFASDTCNGDNTFPSDCDATVGEGLDCFDALYNASDADVCGGVIPEECAPILSCQ